MPIISMFDGMKIIMRGIGREHNPPHFHVESGSYACMVDIRTGEIIEGTLPKNKRQLLEKWFSLHQEELYNIWKTQEFVRIAPL